jgi:hypothetical protein
MTKIIFSDLPIAARVYIVQQVAASALGVVLAPRPAGMREATYAGCIRYLAGLGLTTAWRGLYRPPRWKADNAAAQRALIEDTSNAV